jgi:hypothetical protein
MPMLKTFFSLWFSCSWVSLYFVAKYIEEVLFVLAAVYGKLIERKQHVRWAK